MKRKLIIYFAGIDGSGKTTVAESLRDSLRDSGLSCEYLWCGWRGFESSLFKPIASRTKNALTQKGEEDKVQNAHRTLPFFGYLTWLDYFLRVYPRLIASLLTHDIILTDRYIYDVLVGLGSSDKKVSPFLLSLFKVFPRPSLVFFISVPPEIAYARKDDIPSIDFLREIERKNLKMLEKSSIDIISLDGTRSKDELRDTTLTITQSMIS